MLKKTIYAALLAAWVFCPSASFAQSSDYIERGVTQPSSRKEIAFPIQAIIGKVHVKQGDRIKQGGTLMEQDDRIEERRLHAMTLDADRSLIIKAKQATLENKKVELKRKTDLYKNQALSESEFLLAELDVILAEAEVDSAKHEEKIKVAERQTQEERVKQMTLYAPVECKVLKIVQTEGEMADIDRPSIIVVQNDPLYIEVKTLSTEIVQQLKYDQELDVRYKDNQPWQKAKINFIAPEADARAGTQTFRLEMPNPDWKDSGLQISVKIPADAVAAAQAPGPQAAVNAGK